MRVNKINFKTPVSSAIGIIKDEYTNHERYIIAVDRNASFSHTCKRCGKSTERVFYVNEYDDVFCSYSCCKSFILEDYGIKSN